MPGKPVILLISVPSLECCEKSHMTALRVAGSLTGQLPILENYSLDIPWMAEKNITTAFRRGRAEELQKQTKVCI